MQLCLQIELAEEISQSLHSQKSPRWGEQMYFKKEKNRYFEWYKQLVYAGPKSARNILTNSSPNLAPKTRPDLQLWMVHTLNGYLFRSLEEYNNTICCISKS